MVIQQMRLLNEFSYSDIAQRRIILLNEFISFMMMGLIYFGLSSRLQFYFFYKPVLNIVFLTALCGLFFGNLAGRLIFKRVNNSRLIYIFVDLLFISACGIYFYNSLTAPSEIFNLLYLSVKKSYLLIVISFFIAFIAGIKTNYFLKVLCGDFIDDKNGTGPFFFCLLSGLFTGIVAGIALYYYSSYYYLSGVTVVIAAPTLFLIRLSYNPPPIYAQELGGTEEEKPSGEYIRRDDLFYTYLTFTYIIVYLILGIESFSKIYRDYYYIRTIFIVVSLASVFCGFYLAGIFSRSFRYLYAEMLYPFCFIASLISIYKLKDITEFYIAGVFFAPAFIVFGFSLYHTLTYIVKNYNHKNRYNILDFSFFVLPAPIIIILTLIKYTNLVFIIILYLIIAANIIIPWIYFFRSNARPYKKILCTAALLIIIPLLFVFHSYYTVSPVGELYAGWPVSGIADTAGNDYKGGPLNKNTDIFINHVKAFRVKDEVVRNMKRSVFPALMFFNDNGSALFIDGYRAFFKNPVHNYFKNAVTIDYIPQKFIPPASGAAPDGSTERSCVLEYFSKRNSPFDLIVDIPNLFDQSRNAFRFSYEYYDVIKQHLSPDGIFVQIYDIKNCRAEFMLQACEALNKSFREGISFLFADLLVVVCADNPSSLEISRENIWKIRQILAGDDVKDVFYSELHLLSHILFLEVDDIIVYLEKERVDPFFFLRDFRNIKIDSNLIANYIEKNDMFLKLIKNDADSTVFREEIRTILRTYNSELSLLKKAEINEAEEKYENAAEDLLTLRNRSSGDYRLWKYVSGLLETNSEYYYRLALRLEKEKKWEDARTLYRAILLIDKDNFEANYRLGILCITLQNFDESLNYLQYALRLKSGDPGALFQMGVLHFSRGEPGVALEYFNQVLWNYEKKQQIYLYLGLCNEELGRLQEAKRNYELAMIEDENDIKIKLSLDRISMKILEDRDKWKPVEKKSQTEVEVGEDMPLPIIDTARKVRLTEEEAVLFEKKGEKEENGKAEKGGK